MLKFFRKYNKLILGVGFAFLMVVFLLPAGVSQLVGDPRGRPVFEYDGGVITQGDLNRASQELQFLSRMHPAFLSVLLNVERPEHWLLLTREAEAGGFVGGPDDGLNSLSQLAQTFADFELRQIYGSDFAQIFSQRQQVTQAMQNILGQQRAAAINDGQPAEAIDRILAKARGVVRLYTNYLNTQVLSQPELVLTAKDLIESVTLKYASIDASTLVDAETPAPGESEVQEQFAIYRDIEPGAGAHGFGYLREPAVQLEWMIVSRREIEDAITLDPIDVNVHWQRNQDRFGDDFNTAQPRVERELRDQQIERAFGIARQVIKGRLLQAQSNLPQSEDGVVIVPDDWETTRPTFEAIGERVAEEISNRLGLEIVAPDIISDPRWLTQLEVQTLPVIGTSRIVVGRQPTPAAEFVFSIPELGGEGGFGLHEGLAFPDPLQSSAGNLIFVRVKDARPQSPPESLDEVRAQIENDLKRLYEYEQLVARSSEIAESAGAADIETATEPFGVDLIFPGVIVTRDAFTRPTRASEEDLDALRSAVLEKAAMLDPTTPLSETPMADRVVLVPLPSALTIALMEITQVSPLSLEQFQSLANQVLLNERTSLRVNYDWPFSDQNMRARHHVVALNVSEEIEDAVADEEADADATAEDAE